MAMYGTDMVHVSGPVRPTVQEWEALRLLVTSLWYDRDESLKKVIEHLQQQKPGLLITYVVPTGREIR